MEENSTTISMQNDAASLGIKENGGAISHFRLHEDGINPLSFRMRQDDNGDAYFEGHFICLPRWGDPSPGEKKAGLHKHGSFSRMPWNIYREGNKTYMQATSGREGITLNRILTLDPQQACFEVEEKITNFHALGCLYDMVQHPTLAAPFLSADTIVDCNATTGFDNDRKSYDKKDFTEWPNVISRQGATINLSRPGRPAYSGVYSFIVNPMQTWGWITAYAPQHRLLIGYIWKRKDYPWINMWLHYEEDRLLYRGLEFGASGMHKPFHEMLDLNLIHLLNEKTCLYLDAGGQEIRRYYCFLQKTPPGYNGVQQVEIKDTHFVIREKGTAAAIYLPHSFNLNQS